MIASTENKGILLLAIISALATNFLFSNQNKRKWWSETAITSHVLATIPVKHHGANF